MKKLIVLGLFVLCGIAACGKSQAQGIFGWEEIKVPDGCKVKQIATQPYGTYILCEDGRVFRR